MSCLGTARSTDVTFRRRFGSNSGALAIGIVLVRAIADEVVRLSIVSSCRTSLVSLPIGRYCTCTLEAVRPDPGRPFEGSPGSSAGVVSRLFQSASPMTAHSSSIADLADVSFRQRSSIYWRELGAPCDFKLTYLASLGVLVCTILCTSLIAGCTAIASCLHFIRVRRGVLRSLRYRCARRLRWQAERVEPLEGASVRINRSM